MSMLPGDAEDGWVDATITIADGRVLVTPAESDELHCLDLLDGSVLWNKPRGDSLYLGCVQDGVVLLVGRGGVRGLKLADGSPAWDAEVAQLPTGSAPSGRGFFNSGRYYLPLSTAEVAALDVRSGEVVARSKSRKGTIPGNLICYQGSVISQGVTHLESFYELAELERQVAQTLKEQPDNPEALALRGEVLLQEGKLDEAVVHLRRAHQAHAEPRTQQLLAEALLELLRTDYASHRGSLAELEKLVDRPDQQSALWRLIAAGEQQSGNRLQAFDAYLKLTSLPAGGKTLERIDNSLSVRRDRWVQARLAELWRQASPDELKQMNAEVAARLAEAKSRPRRPSRPGRSWPRPRSPVNPRWKRSWLCCGCRARLIQPCRGQPWPGWQRC
jgi:tetratricopeptide (TPR) repeat protein